MNQKITIMNQMITMEDIRNYAAASKDNAAIHLEPEAAAAAGYPRPVAHGMYIMGLAQSLYLKEHPKLWITDCSMKFQKPLVVETMAYFKYESIEEQISVSVTLEMGEVIATGRFRVKEVL